VVSADPIYRLPGEEIAARVRAVVPRLAERMRNNPENFVWGYFRSMDHLIETRLAATETFVGDYASLSASGRYVAASLPALPFKDKAFDLALCAHFLFLYSELYDADFHIRAIRELARTAGEVRVFPLVELEARPSRHLEAVVGALRAEGFRVERMRTPYLVVKGGDEMLRVW
jgi:hypothetical protein